MTSTIPVHILAGFLGSGKTTLLTQAIDYYTALGKKPAVLMNEIGEVNLDGMLVSNQVPMTEMLSGCICCTIRGDLGMELLQLEREHKPDVIFIESTGIANPIEILDGVTDASLMARIELKSVVTVVDAAHLAGQIERGGGKTYRLMQDQIRCATTILLNKTDLVSPQQLQALEKQLREWNEYAPIEGTVMCRTDASMFDRLERKAEPPTATVFQLLNDAGAAGFCEGDACGFDGWSGSASAEHTHHAAADQPEAGQGDGHVGRAKAQETDHSDHEHDSEHAGHDHEHDSDHTYHDHKHDHAAGHAHHSHDHVMVYTHYFERPVDSERFEELLARLPQEVYRAKGIVHFTDTASRFMFQFAYREADFMKINPQGDVPDVAVFIGEHFSKEDLRRRLLELES
ncbi:CobW family GTP-binding protein [Paenibacillus thalictri]|uniref:GTP-binding protein n=1 Tax=Paenibacillus thalictri TaxID=2527873 RepID=A0A4Q9DVM5_9BACL|nr:GTP-binding protein [Paenibacillus thalictri]TBL80334.1 GTP-binding protein [Paenibacillus thalictri]